MAGQSPTGPAHRLIATLSEKTRLPPEDRWDKVKFVTKKAETTDDSTSDPTDIREIVCQFYQLLHTTDPAQGADIDNYINSIDFNQTVNQNDSGVLMLSIAKDEPVEQVKRIPKQSSAGNDGSRLPIP
ncbi:hypothetical protein G6F37_012087 [Rhizopus arrhizus]|nr:hypothetical protein G6F38_012120 [Rhizopus arrhizus]KAG1145778.1 hypothetical protein G6F37_012087 [Rhizopus arrhizus]